MTHGAMWRHCPGHTRHMGCVWRRINSCIAHLRYYRQHLPPISPRQSRTWSPAQARHRRLVAASSVTLSSPWARSEAGTWRLECECHQGVMGRAESRAQCCQGGTMCLCPGQLRSRALPSPGPAVTPALCGNICVSWRELQQLSHTGHQLQGQNNILPIISFLDKMKSLHRPCST